jgi:hypothetical protein
MFSRYAAAPDSIIIREFTAGGKIVVATQTFPNNCRFDSAPGSAFVAVLAPYTEQHTGTGAFTKPATIHQWR